MERVCGRGRIALGLALVTSLILATGAGAAGPFAATAAQSSRPNAHATRAFVPGEVLVRFEASASLERRADILRRHGASLKAMLALPGLTLARLPSGVSPLAAAAALARERGVRYAVPNFIRRLAGVPNDPRFGSLWALRASLDADIDAAEAWDISTGDAAVVVAVVDSGIALNHPDLAPNVWTNPGETAGNSVDDDGNGFVDDTVGWDFANGDNVPLDSVSHGSHVAGTIGAVGNNGLGVTGLNWNVKLMAVRAGDAYGLTDAAIVNAFAYACANGARVINASFGAPDDSPAIENAIALCPNSLFVIAAGNDGSDNDDFPIYPCSYPNVNIICVAATNKNDARTSFSNYGATSVDLAAPGVSILSTVPAWEAPLFAANFDSSLVGWLAEKSTVAGQLWSRTSERSASGLYSITDSRNANYANNANTWIRSASPFDFAGRAGCRLIYSTLVYTEEDYDFMFVEGSRDAVDWITFWAYTGYANGRWYEDLSAFDGAPFLVRFRLESDESYGDDGAYVDDVEIRCLALAAGAGNYAAFDGTSMAAPHVSGVAALVWAQNPSRSVADVKNILMSSGDVKASLVGRTVTGRRLNAFKALGGILPRVSIRDATLRERNSGTHTMRFAVTLSEAPTTYPVQVSYATANGTAKARYDYKARRGTLTFPVGVSTQYVSVPIIGDRRREATESFFVNLSWPLHTDLYDRRAVGRIRNDD